MQSLSKTASDLPIMKLLATFVALFFILPVQAASPTDMGQIVNVDYVIKAFKNKWPTCDLETGCKGYTVPPRNASCTQEQSKLLQCSVPGQAANVDYIVQISNGINRNCGFTNYIINDARKDAINKEFVLNFLNTSVCFGDCVDYNFSAIYNPTGYTGKYSEVALTVAGTNSLYQVINKPEIIVASSKGTSFSYVQVDSGTGSVTVSAGTGLSDACVTNGYKNYSFAYNNGIFFGFEGCDNAQAGEGRAIRAKGTTLGSEIILNPSCTSDLSSYSHGTVSLNGKFSCLANLLVAKGYFIALRRADCAGTSDIDATMIYTSPDGKCWKEHAGILPTTSKYYDMSLIGSDEIRFNEFGGKKRIVATISNSGDFTRLFETRSPIIAGPISEYFDGSDYFIISNKNEVAISRTGVCYKGLGTLINGITQPAGSDTDQFRGKCAGNICMLVHCTAINCRQQRYAYISFDRMHTWQRFQGDKNKQIGAQSFSTNPLFALSRIVIIGNILLYGQGSETTKLYSWKLD